MSQTFTSPQDQFDAAYRALLPDLNPAGSLERMFAEKLARETVLLERAQFQLIQLNPLDEGNKTLFRQLSSLISAYERAQKFAYTELRRLQAQRAAEMPAETTLSAKPRLARVAILTKTDGSLRKDAPLPASTIQPPSTTVQTAAA